MAIHRLNHAVLYVRDVARSETGVASLYDATGDQPARSARYREYLAPQGYGDNLRAARLYESAGMRPAWRHDRFEKSADRDD